MDSERRKERKTKEKKACNTYPGFVGSMRCGRVIIKPEAFPGITGGRYPGFDISCFGYPFLLHCIRASPPLSNPASD